MSRLPLAVLLFLIFNTLLTSCDSQKAVKKTGVASNLNTKWTAGTYDAHTQQFFLVGEETSIISSKDGAVWTTAKTELNGDLKSVLASEDKSLIIAVGTQATVIRSTDSGKTWNLTKISLPSEIKQEEINFSALSYNKKHKVWLAGGTQNSIIYSDDDGKTWELVSYDGSDNQLEILDFYVDKESGDTLFAAQHGVTGRSLDGGKNWDIVHHPLEGADSYVPHILKFYPIQDRLFAAADEGNFLISDDKGYSWQYSRVPSLGYISNIARDPSKNTLVLTTQTGEIFFSADQGENWQAVSFEVQSWPNSEIPYLSKLYYDNKSASFVIVGNSGLIARSNDGGKTWYADIYRPLKNLSVTTLIRNTEENVYVSAGLGGVIARTEALGITALPVEGWSLVQPGIDAYIRDVVHLPNSSTFIAVGQLGGVWLSENDGKNWSLIEVDYPLKNQPPHLRDIILDPDGSTLIAAGPAGSIIRSTDSGKTWGSVYRGDFSKGEAFTQLIYDANNKLYYAPEVLYGNILVSSDLGQQWQQTAKVERGERRLWHGAVFEKQNAVVLVGQKGGIALGRNQGKDWTMVEPVFMQDLYGVYADDRGFIIAVGDDGKILRSEDAENWQSVASDTLNRLRRVIKSPNDGGLIALGAEGTILRSEDLGKQWSKVSLESYRGELRTGITNDDGALVIVGQNGGIFVSKDSGLSWESVQTATGKHFRSAAINPLTGTVIAVGEALVRSSID